MKSCTQVSMARGIEIFKKTVVLLHSFQKDTQTRQTTLGHTQHSSQNPSKNPKYKPAGPQGGKMTITPLWTAQLFGKASERISQDTARTRHIQKIAYFVKNTALFAFTVGIAINPCFR